MIEPSNKQKIVLIIFGIFLSVCLLEIGLRVGGGVFLLLQEHGNKISIKENRSYRILCLGESTTALGGVNSYPRQLEQILNNRNMGINFSVINKGVPATETNFILKKLDENIKRYQPDVVIAMMGINDEGDIVSYDSRNKSGALEFIQSFKTFKLAKSVYFRLNQKIKDCGLIKVREKKAVAFLGAEQFEESEKFDNQEEFFKWKIKMEPENDLAYVQLGDYYTVHQEFDLAEDMLKQAIRLNPRNNKAYVELACSYMDNNDVEKYKRTLYEAIEINPENDEAYSELGEHYLTRRMLDKALAMSKKALELNPDNEGAYIFLGRSYALLGQLDKAKEIYEQGIGRNFNNDRIYGAAAVFYNNLGKSKIGERYSNMADQIRLNFYKGITRHNYLKLKEILYQRKIKFVAVQYPMRSVRQLKKMIGDSKGVAFVDNERIFKDAIKKMNFDEYFSDSFAGDFGHCTPKGNRLLAGNIADVIVQKIFHQ